MGTLIMLVPFTSINFSTVKAQEYGTFDDDYYDDDMYSTYPTENNKYECQKGPFEGFFVGSVEFCKHIKFDKDDRKDNNRTGTQGPPGPQGVQGPIGPQGPPGPAGGQTGPQGPPGPPGVPGPQGERGLTGLTGPSGTASTVPGPQGPRGFNGTDGVNGTQGPQGPRGFNGTDGVNGTQGPQGPPGVTFMNDTNTYTRIASSTNIPLTTPPFYSQAFAVCDPGDLAISGGFIGPPPGTPQATAYDAIPIVDLQSPNNWGVVLKSPTHFEQFNAKVLCFNNP